MIGDEKKVSSLFELLGRWPDQSGHFPEFTYFFLLNIEYCATDQSLPPQLPYLADSDLSQEEKMKKSSLNPQESIALRYAKIMAQFYNL